MRVYIPATFSMLEVLVEEHAMPVRSALAFAATPALIESFTEGDMEEFEHHAFLEASRASLRLLQAEGANRRVVISADLDDDTLTFRPDLDTAVVKLESPTLALDAVAAVHVDLQHNADTVTHAAELVDEADLGDEDAELAVGDALDLDLAWFDPVELPFLVELG